MKSLLLILLTGIGIYSQTIEFDPPWTNHSFFIQNYGSDPAFISDNNWGYLGTWNNRIYQIHTNILYVNGTYVTSDERAKENIKDLPSVLGKLDKINPVTYDYKKENTQTGSEDKNTPESEKLRKNKIGFLAQNIKTEFPELVDYNEENDVYSVNYDGMIPVLLKAIKEQQAQIDALTNQLKSK